jgi:hypothetical protein
MMTSRNARLALAVAIAAVAVAFHPPLLALVLARLAAALLAVVTLWPWRRCGQCSALVTRRYVVEFSDGRTERLCVTCGAQYAELIEG